MNLIDYSTFLYAFFGFLSLVVLQILWWRLLKSLLGEVRPMIFWMFAIFLFLPIFGWFLTGELAGTVLLLSLSLGYLFGFPAVVAKSPSLEMIRFLQTSGGATTETIIKELADEDVLKGKIIDLASDRMATMQNGNIALTPFGKIVGGCFYYYRKVLGLPQGRG